MHRLKTFVSEVGSPMHTTGESSPKPSDRRCQLGILGPPVSPIPLALRLAAETLASGEPTSWKLSTTNSCTTLTLNWTINTGPPSNYYTLFPPRLMTAIAAFSSLPNDWSLEQEKNHLICSIILLPKSTTAANPVSPEPSPTLRDSGFSSPTTFLSPPASPIKTSSPLPCSLPAHTDYQSNTPPAKLTRDASTVMPHSYPKPIFSTATQTSNPTTAESGVQASTITITTTKDAKTQSSDLKPEPPAHLETCDKATSCTQTTPNDSPSCSTDASMTYDPPQTDRWCSFCHGPVSHDEPPLLHLVSQCGATPEEILLPLEKLNKELGQKLRIPRRTVRAASSLLLSRHDPNITIPQDLITEFVMKLIPDTNEYHTFMKTTDDLTTTVIHQLQTHLSLDPSTTDLSNIFTTIEPTESIPSDDDDDDDDPAYDVEPDWADIAEYYTYFGHEDAYDDCF